MHHTVYKLCLCALQGSVTVSYRKLSFYRAVHIGQCDSTDWVTGSLPALLLHLGLERLSGHQRAINNPHLPTTQEEKPFEAVGVFPLPSSPPLSQDTAF